MGSSGELKVSTRGQMSLPVEARRRWGLNEGGSVGFLDVGDAVVLVPGGIDLLRDQALDAVAATDWESAQDGFGDAELATE